jgi:CTP synthase
MAFEDLALDRHAPEMMEREPRLRDTCYKIQAEHPVIHIMADQKDVSQMGGTMRLGAYPAVLAAGTRTREVYGTDRVSERHRHRYEVNNNYRDELTRAGLTLSGLSPDGKLVEIVEIPEHPWFLAVQFHPEFKSKPHEPHPLFLGFVEAALNRRQERAALDM